ncbi:MAG TPA: hypothetical protein VLD39_03890, partial [Gammaproteobacteria bacterium]|nr:hypothetical protein [Gammaproteobacteria bacterium]
SPATQLSFGIERQTRKGASTTTLDIERDEFELDRPLDESLNLLSFGVQHRWDKVTLIFDEELREFENTSEVFLPGASRGQNTGDPAELLFFRLDQSYDFRSRRHSLRLMADPTTRLNVQAALQREDLELDLQAEESASGTGFTGVPFDTLETGRSAIGRDIGHAAFEFTFAISDRVRLAGAAKTSSLEQSGLLLFAPGQDAGDWQIDTHGVELGFEVAAGADWVLAAGWSGESRDAEYSQSRSGLARVDRETTDRDGYYARLLYAPQNGLELTASIENDSIDDPFTLASATDNTRYEIAIRKRWDNGIAVTGNHRRTDMENGRSGWSAETVQTDLRGIYRTDRIEFSAGWGEIEVDRAIDQLVTAGTRQELFMIDYDADSVFWDTSLSWVVNGRLVIGSSLRKYDNGGSFPLERDDLRVFTDIALGASYMFRLSYRDLEYDEDAFDAYDARILEVGLRVGW